ncbi:MAG TPA: PTS sugar transporter subunit IIA [Candidatus Dormibacteraeota bacterium]|nr:PTS sugar transporter subunit IIA [Candidatus Dormibacteraeota bacterium]
MSVAAPSSLYWSSGLVRRFSSADGPEDAIRLVGNLLIKAGAATAAHVEAAVRREAEYPTGLPASVPFALAHTDAPGALRLAAAVGIFEQPVVFRRMDRPSEMLPVRLVAMLTVPRRHMQAELLSNLIKGLASPGVAEQLLEAPPPDALRLLRGVTG